MEDPTDSTSSLGKSTDPVTINLNGIKGDVSAIVKYIVVQTNTSRSSNE